MTDQYPPNRRDAIAHLFGAVAAAALLMKSKPAGATPDATAAPPTDAGADAAIGDATILNALLEVELDAIAAYTAGAGVLTAVEDAGANDAGADPNASLAKVVLAVAVHFRAQHMEHRAALTTLIEGLNGIPITSSSFAPPPGFKPSVLNVMKLACNAERAAAVVYTNALKGLDAPTAATLAASIGGVETQHFVVLYSLIQGLVTGTATTLAHASDLVPQAFVATVGTGTKGLEAVPEFAFS